MTVGKETDPAHLHNEPPDLDVSDDSLHEVEEEPVFDADDLDPLSHFGL